MPHFRVDDALHSHPKARKAGLEAMGLWLVAGSHCMGYLSDGFVPEWFVKTWPKGAALAKRLVDAGLWTLTHVDGEKGWQFHQFVGNGRNDSRERIEADRANARDRMRGARGTTNDRSSPEHPTDVRPNKHRTPAGRSPEVPGIPNPTHKQNTGYLPTTTHESHPRAAAADNRKRHPNDAARTVVRQTLGDAGYPKTTTDRLAVQVEDLARDGHADTLIREAIAEWDRRDDCTKPEFLPTVLGDIVKRSRAAPSEKLSKLRSIAELARQERAAENAQLEAQHPKELA